MEEAEVLCDRIGIIDKGNFLCVGSQDELKDKFGKGYRLTINFNDHDQEINNDVKVIRDHPLIKQIVNDFGGNIINELTSRVIFKIQKKDVIKCISILKKHTEITWLGGQPNLYDWFAELFE